MILLRICLACLVGGDTFGGVLGNCFWVEGAFGEGLWRLPFFGGNKQKKGWYETGRTNLFVKSNSKNTGSYNHSLDESWMISDWADRELETSGVKCKFGTSFHAEIFMLQFCYLVTTSPTKFRTVNTCARITVGSCGAQWYLWVHRWGFPKHSGSSKLMHFPQCIYIYIYIAYIYIYVYISLYTNHLHLQLETITEPESIVHGRPVQLGCDMATTRSFLC